MANTSVCLDALVECAVNERPDIIIIPGDIFHTARVWSDRAIAEVKLASEYLTVLANIAPVAVLYGTPNHDGAAQFDALEKMVGVNTVHQVIFYTIPCLHSISTAAGPVLLAGLPGFDKGHFRAQFPGLSAEEENQIFSEQLSQIVQGLSAQLTPGIPFILMAHHTVVGCEMDNGTHIFQANEIVLSSSALDSSNFDIACLGHIHRPQEVIACQKPVFYAGSIDATTFNDEGNDKGFWIHEIDENLPFDRYSNSRYIKTPHTEFITLNWPQDAVQAYNEIGISGFGNIEKIRNKVVRVLYSCDPATEKALDKKKLERDLLSAGAYYVSEIRPERIEASVNREAMTEKLTVVDCLKRYLEEKKLPNAELIIQEAMPLIQQAEASTIAGGQSGLFLPLEISVKNYRSYAEETFSFMDIYFAMVNGVNGCGKSSLFMDAPSDCLFEEPREGELTGWIRTGQKSGSISFTFMLGKDTWRVTRTRTRSGKGTLALAKLVSMENEWEDHSCSKMDDTKKKIIELLGMDCNTFQSCVLIMQNKYGLFLEAQSDDRMAILANLLGLGIYDQLENLSDKKRLEVSRILNAKKDESSKLIESVEAKETLQIQKENELFSLEILEAKRLTQKEAEKNIQATIDEAAKVEQEVKQLLSEVAQLELSKNQKQLILDELDKNYATTCTFLSNESHYISQHEMYLNKVDKLSDLSGKKLLKDIKVKSLNEKSQRLASVKSAITNIESEIEQTNKLLKDRPNIVEFLAANQNIDDLIETQQKEKEECIRINGDLNDLNNKLSSHNIEVKAIELRLSQKLNNAAEKAKMLENSNCIDAEHAKCKFLADAVEAKEHVPGIEKEIAQEKERLINIAADLQSQIQVKNLELESNCYKVETLGSLLQRQRECNIKKQQLAAMDAQQLALSTLEKRLIDLKQQLSELQIEAEIEQEEVETLTAECEGYEKLSTELEALKHDEDKYHKIPSGKQYLASIEPQINMVRTEIKELAEGIDLKKLKAADIQKNNKDHSSIKLNLEAVKQEIVLLDQQIAMANRTIGGIDEKLQRIAECEVQMQGLKAEIDNLASQVNTYQILQNAFSQDGIPHQIIRDIIPELEANANEILSQMTGGWMRVDFKTEKVVKSNKSKEIATLDIITTDAYYGEMPYLSRSGGQRTRINLAVGFALAIIKASRVGLQLGMLFVDEPSWLDEKGTEEYCMALQTIHNKYPEMRIVAISHDASMKASFPQQILVEMTDEGSKVRRL
jgi:exonuclease SbcC